jgi:hypothetical protein
MAPEHRLSTLRSSWLGAAPPPAIYQQVTAAASVMLVMGPGCPRGRGDGAAVVHAMSKDHVLSGSQPNAVGAENPSGQVKRRVRTRGEVRRGDRDGGR